MLVEGGINCVVHYLTQRVGSNFFQGATFGHAPRPYVQLIQPGGELRESGVDGEAGDWPTGVVQVFTSHSRQLGPVGGMWGIDHRSGWRWCWWRSPYPFQGRLSQPPGPRSLTPRGGYLSFSSPFRLPSALRSPRGPRPRPWQHGRPALISPSIVIHWIICQLAASSRLNRICPRSPHSSERTVPHTCHSIPAVLAILLWDNVCSAGLLAIRGVFLVGFEQLGLGATGGYWPCRQCIPPPRRERCFGTPAGPCSDGCAPIMGQWPRWQRGGHRPSHIITMAMKARSLTVHRMISNRSPSRVTRFHWA